MKDIIVNGKTHNGVSFLEVLTTAGVSALFKDMDEVSGGGMPGLAEVASGVFTVEKETTGNPDPNNTAHVAVEHGMSGMPDGYAVFPKYFYDTQDNNLVGAIRVHGQHFSRGRRVIANNTWQNSGGDAVADMTATHIYPQGNAFGSFKPTYIDNEGNEGQQEYIWIAWRMAE